MEHKQIADHTVGAHLGVTGDRLDKIKDEFIDYMEDIEKRQLDVCDCDLIKKAMEIGKTPEEIATLAFSVGQLVQIIEQRAAARAFTTPNTPTPGFARDN